MRICSYVKTWSLISAPSFPWGSIFKQNWIFLKFHSKIQVFWPNCFIKEELPRDFQLLLITCICSWKRVCPFILTNLHSVCLEFLYSIFVGIDLCFWGRSQKCKKVYCRTEKRQADRQTERQTGGPVPTDRQTPDKRWSEKLTWAFKLRWAKNWKQKKNHATMFILFIKN